MLPFLRASMPLAACFAPPSSLLRGGVAHHCCNESNPIGCPRDAVPQYDPANGSNREAQLRHRGPSVLETIRAIRIVLARARRCLSWSVFHGRGPVARGAWGFDMEASSSSSSSSSPLPCTWPYPFFDPSRGSQVHHGVR